VQGGLLDQFLVLFATHTKEACGTSERAARSCWLPFPHRFAELVVAPHVADVPTDRHAARKLPRSATDCLDDLAD